MKKERRGLKRSNIDTFAMLTEISTQKSKIVLVRDLHERGLMLYQFKGEPPKGKSVVVELFNPVTRTIFQVSATILRCEKIGTRWEMNLEISQKTRMQQAGIQSVIQAKPSELQTVAL